MPTARGAPGSAEVGGIAYAIGGVPDASGTTILATVEAYDPTTDTWASRASMPTARALLGVAEINGTIYAVGGCTGPSCSIPLATVEAYDPTTDTWATKASMPTARYGLAVGVINGILYAIGGANAFGVLNTVEAYDPATDTWQIRASLPTPRRLVGGEVLGGSLYVVGGRDGSDTAVATVESYDPVTDSWAGRAPMPTARGTFATAVLDGRLFAVGGFAGPGLPTTPGLSVVESYDPGTDTWMQNVPMPTSRGGLAAGTISGRLFALGGTPSPSGSVALATVEVFTPTPPRVYVAIPPENRIGIIDTATDMVVDDIPLPSSPSSITASSGGKFLLALLPSQGQLAKVDLSTKAITFTADVPSIAGAVALHPNQQKAYVTQSFNAGNNAVAVVDLNTGSVTSIPVFVPGEFGPAFILNVNVSPNGQKAYVSFGVSSTLAVIDAQNDMLLPNVFSPPSYHDEVAFSADSSIAIASSRGLNCPTNGGFSKLDAVNDVHLQSFNLPNGTIGARIDAAAAKAYVPDTCGTGNLLVFNLGSSTFEAPVPTMLAQPEGVLLFESLGKAYVGDGAMGKVSVVDVVNRTHVTTLQLSNAVFGVGPRTMTSGPAPPIAPPGPPPQLPDMIVESLTHSPSNPTTADLITFTAVVRNVGTGPAGASTLELRIGNETPGPQTLFAIPFLVSGGSSSVQRQMVLSVAQNYVNTATADVNNQVIESDETNNQQTDGYAVVLPFGTIEVNTNTNSAEFALTGPATFSGSGKVGTFLNVPIGVYTITYGPNCRSDLPASETKTVTPGAVITFTGSYSPGFLDFPLANQSTCTARVNSVFDHSMSFQYCADTGPQIWVTAYTGEQGTSDSASALGARFKCPLTGASNRLFGFQQDAAGTPFTVAGLYVGAGTPQFLFYDAHPGYDYRTKDHNPDGSLCPNGTLCNPSGKTRVLAAADGTVVCVSDDKATCPEGPGEVKIDHGNGFFTIYLHLSKITVSVGQHVTSLQEIGVSGDIGAKNNPHLHFEVRKNIGGILVPVDPYGWKGTGMDPYLRATNVNLWR